MDSFRIDYDGTQDFYIQRWDLALLRTKNPDKIIQSSIDHGVCWSDIVRLDGFVTNLRIKPD